MPQRKLLNVATKRVDIETNNLIDCRLASVELETPPIFDGMIAVGNKLFLSLMNGQVVCYAGRNYESN
jgi:hypothetical protein